MGEKRTKPNHLNISERQRYLIRRERKKSDCLCPLSGRAGAEWEELMRSWFVLVSSFSCHQERAEQGTEAAVDMVYPAPCWPWVPLVKEDQQLGLLWLPGAVNDRWFLEV